MEVFGRNHHRLSPGGAERPRDHRGEQPRALLVGRHRERRIASPNRQFQQRRNQRYGLVRVEPGQAIVLDRKYAHAYNNWGNALDSKQDYDGAIAKYQQAIALDPKDAYVYNGWGNALKSKQDYDGAIAKYQQALKLDPKNQMFRGDLEAAEAEKKKIK
jgi:tetratricopeptide (TPR) repeat protein